MIEFRRAWRIIVLVGSFLVLTYFGLNEVHGQSDLAAWLVLIGAIALCTAWAKFWPSPE